MGFLVFICQENSILIAICFGSHDRKRLNFELVAFIKEQHWCGWGSKLGSHHRTNRPPTLPDLIGGLRSTLMSHNEAWVEHQLLELQS